MHKLFQLLKVQFQV